MTAFEKYIYKTFGDHTAHRIAHFFNLMGLPMPEDKDEFVVSQEGALVFLTHAGIVLRMEEKHSTPTLEGENRPDHPLVLQPLGTIDCGDTVIEICPGIHVGGDKETVHMLEKQLAADGINFHDPYGPNIGSVILPDRTVHMVIDRLSVKQLSAETRATQDLLQKHGNPQAVFAPLKEAFAHALAQQTFKSQSRSMQYFLKLCQDFKANGKLVCGWHDTEESRGKCYDYKNLAAHQAGLAYQKRIGGME